MFGLFDRMCACHKNARKIDQFKWKPNVNHLQNAQFRRCFHALHNWVWSSLRARAFWDDNRYKLRYMFNLVHKIWINVFARIVVRVCEAHGCIYNSHTQCFSLTVSNVHFFLPFFPSWMPFSSLCSYVLINYNILALLKKNTAKNNSSKEKKMEKRKGISNMCKRRQKNHTAAQIYTRALTHESKMQTAICPFTVQSNEKKTRKIQWKLYKILVNQ